MDWVRQRYYGEEHDELVSLMRFAELTGGLAGHPSASDLSYGGWMIYVLWPDTEEAQLARIKTIAA